MQRFCCWQIQGEKPCVAVVRCTEAKVTPSEVAETAGVRAGGRWFLFRTPGSTGPSLEICSRGIIAQAT